MKKLENSEILTQENTIKVLISIVLNFVPQTKKMITSRSYNLKFYLFTSNKSSWDQKHAGLLNNLPASPNKSNSLLKKLILALNPLSDGIQIMAVLMGGGIECPPSKNLENEATESCEGSK